MKKTLPILLALVLFIYPAIIYFGLQYVEPGFLAVFFGVLFALRFVVIKRVESKNALSDIQDKSIKKKSMIPHTNVVLIAVLCLLSYSTFANSAVALKMYPVVVSLSFLAIFSYSLVKPPSVVEMIARLHEELDDEGVIYTRKVTKVWCVFFIVNALIATGTVFYNDEKIWLLYNGLISYLIMGTLMAVEFVVRFFVKRAAKNNNQENLSKASLLNNSELND